MSTVLLLDAFTVVVTACKNYRKKKPMETWDVQRHALGVHATCRVPRVTDPLFAEEGRPSEVVRSFMRRSLWLRTRTTTIIVVRWVGETFDS